MNEKQNTKIASNKLREFRIMPHISQYELALRSGVYQSRISLIENFLVKPTTHEKTKLAQALNQQENEIFPDNAAD